MNKYKFCVIGAGVVGGLLARELTKYTKDVIILEKENDVAMGQSKANSGIVHAGYDPNPGSLKAILNVKGCELMERVANDLDVKYRKNGTLVVGFNEEDEKGLKKLYERGLENKVKDLYLISGDEVRNMEKNISKDVTIALYAKSAGVVCPYELTIHAVGNAMDNGAELLTNFSVKRIERRDGYFEIEGENGDIVFSEYVINCAGLYSDYIANLVGDRSFKINPRVGEYFILDKDCGDMVDMTIFRTPTKMGKGVLAVKTVDGNILLGPTSLDIADKMDKAVTREGLDIVIEKEKEFFSEIPWDKVITQFAGLRAHSDRGDFIIDSPVENYINCAGIESPGLTASPAIAEYVVSMLKDMKALDKERTDFSGKLKRINFSKLTNEEKNELLRTRPEFSRIICRCEEVTEGEILEAIRNNPPAKDVDGIKRRTRAGMGRCQGGFCMPLVIEILENELGIRYTDVTKMGGLSYYTYTKTKTGGEKVEAKK